MLPQKRSGQLGRSRTSWSGLASLADVSTLLCVLVAEVAGLDVFRLAAVDIRCLGLDGLIGLRTGAHSLVPEHPDWPAAEGIAALD